MNYYLQNVYIRRVTLAVALDALCFSTAAGITWWLTHPPFTGPLFAGATLLGAGLCFLALYYCDAYRPAVLGDGARTRVAILNAMAIAFVVALLTYFAVKTPRSAVASLASVAALYFPLLLFGRGVFRVMSGLPSFSERVVVVGASDLGQEIAEAVHERPNLGIELVGFLSDEADAPGELLAGVPVLGRVHEIEKLVDAHRVGIIVVASKSRDEYFPADELLASKLRGRQVESGVSFYERLSGRIYLRDLRPSYLIFSKGFRKSVMGDAIKRSIDFTAAFVGLLLCAPVLALCALAIRIDSRGPAFLSQERVGLGGRPFRMWKLRSMSRDAEKKTGPVWTAGSDVRITRVGRILRKARLDEAPQLFNVLLGDMSIVGPRPERPEFVDSLCARYPYFRLRSAVKPGLTGWAQIRHGYVNEVKGFEEKLALDLYYMKYRSLAMDLLILWQTVKTVILLRGI